MPGAVYQPFPMLAGRRAQAWRHQPQFSRPRHFHAEPELNLVVRGWAEVGLGGRRCRVNAGQVLVFEPGQDHALLAASADLDLFVLGLSPALVERIGWLPAVAEPFAPCSALSLVERAEQLIALAEVRDAGAVECALVDTFAELVRPAQRASSLTRRAVDSAKAEPKLTGGALANRLTTHPSQLSRVFQRDLAVPLVEFRSRLKVIQFIRLVDGGRTLLEAAFEAEFGSYAQCHRAFRRVTGCSPRDYFDGARTSLDQRVLGEHSI